MHCLWVTYADPEPRHNGQYVYSGGLIDALAGSGARVDVVGLARPGQSASTKRSTDAVRWWLADFQAKPSWMSLLSPLPHVADRGRTPALQRMLASRLASETPDVIVFDGISAAWALRPVLKCYNGAGRRPKLVYVSHNHETSLRPEVARGQQNPIKRQILQYDAAKAVMLERALLDTVDLVTAITAEDRKLYLQQKIRCPIEVLPPGYDGDRLDERRITQDLPRRAIIVGSFDWIAKRMNLEEFISIADPLFAEHGAELQVVGSAEAEFLKRLRQRVHATQFTGAVEDIDPYMRQSRIALVPERHGGGFKLKVLDYVFNRMPILALYGSVAGVPLQQEDSILLYPDLEALARGVLRVIDDCDRLNRLQDRAFASCQDAFDWPSRGRQLMNAIGAA
ncbi:MAG TPA: glycosyltransferase family 4 protein [Ferrovibrio sp.]|uniref:glycosyltransferase family 4 protein n=1 Tax=Ferrovibrio sp. TaxID=1917215 RepID=UPI002ED1C20C